MRYYSIVLSDAKSGKEVRRYSSFVNGVTLPGALNVEIDAFVVPFATPKADTLVRVWGISLQEISQASDLNGLKVQIYAGMQKGLPLANPKQAGLIVQGVVFQAFGNWIGTDQTLDLIILASTGSPEDPKNIVLDWKQGAPLSEPIANTLSAAFPGYKQAISISPKLVMPRNVPGFYGTLTAFAQIIKKTSRMIIGGDYPGVDIHLQQETFTVYDGTTAGSPKQIAFTDLIGQPTWIESPLIQFKCVMRADISISDYVKLPPALATTTSQSFSQLRDRSVFQGSFQITEVHHIGNFRQADAASWVTVFTATPVPKVN